MQQRDQDRIGHMLEAAVKATGYVEGRAREDLDTDEVLRLALTKLVEIVGEAAKHVTEETRAEHPAVPWSAASRMRDRLVHHYFDINRDILWSTVTEELPKLADVLRTIGADE